MYVINPQRYTPSLPYSQWTMLENDIHGGGRWPHVHSRVMKMTKQSNALYLANVTVLLDPIRV